MDYIAGAPTIGVILDAGLGNQLFMIFTLLSYCIDHLANFVIFYNNSVKKTYWNTLLDAFSNNKSSDIQGNIQIYSEKHFHYSKIPYDGSDLNLKGYFQSYKYFDHNIQRILKIMRFDDKLHNVQDEFKHLLTKKTIALHFRIGDYMGLQHFHPIQKPEYYLKAFEFLTEKLSSNNDDISNYDILYFCQITDNHIVNQYINVLNNNFKNLNFVKVPDNIDDWKQLLIMTSCNHFIIANSTFSWFPAYISQYISEQTSEKTVCHPTHWFGPYYASHSIKDLFIPTWNGFDDT